MTTKRVAKKRAAPIVNLDPLKALLVQLKSYRKQAEDLKDDLIPSTQKEALVALAKFDPDDKGVIFEYDGQEIAAFYQQNDASVYWDAEEVISYLKKNRALWMACSSRVFDVAKWEAEIANGNIPAKEVDKFKKKGDAPAPFVRWGKPKKDSIR